MTNEKVSIIIPVYNAEKSLARTLESVRSQTYRNIEIILVNDGSKDNSLELCKRFEETDDRVILIDKENGGVSSARNNAINVSSGIYLVFVDADDYLETNAIERLMAYRVATGAEYVCASYKLLKTRNRTLDNLYIERYYNTEDMCNEITSLSSVISLAPWGKLFCASIVKENDLLFPADMPYGEDAVFHYNYLKHVKSVYLTSEVLYRYNFTDYSSAANKYYKDYYIYLSKIHHEKFSLLASWKKDVDLRTVKKEEQVVLFERCLEHYILHERITSNLVRYIENSAQAFEVATCECGYSDLLKHKKYKVLVRNWKISNMERMLKHRINTILIKSDRL